NNSRQACFVVRARMKTLWIAPGRETRSRCDFPRGTLRAPGLPTTRDAAAAVPEQNLRHGAGSALVSRLRKDTAKRRNADIRQFIRIRIRGGSSMLFRTAIDIENAL